MQLKITPDNLLEGLALYLNQVPVPLLHGQVFPILSKAVLEAVDRGIFERIEEGHTTAETIAAVCRLHPAATAGLLEVLVPLGYLRVRKQRYSLTKMSRKWLLRDSESSLAALMVYNNRVVWPWLEQLGEFLETGKGLDYHSQFEAAEWLAYQRAMHAVGRAEAREFARKCPVPATARTLLDIGGAHGLHAWELCKRHPALKGVVLDLPGALEQAATLPDYEVRRKSLTYESADILEVELPENTYDVVLMSSLAHHFTREQNRQITCNVARSLRTGGIFIINDFVKPDPGKRPELVGSSSNLFFGLTSTSGTWSIEETREWQLEAGLVPGKVIGYTALPGRFQIVAAKK